MHQPRWQRHGIKSSEGWLISGRLSAMLFKLVSAYRILLQLCPSRIMPSAIWVLCFGTVTVLRTHDAESLTWSIIVRELARFCWPSNSLGVMDFSFTQTRSYLMVMIPQHCIILAVRN